MKNSLLSSWQKDGVVSGVGNATYLELPLTAFFASRRCSGRAIRAAMDWSVQQASIKTPLIGGFHSPLEQSVLEVMLAAQAPVVVVIARKLQTAKLPAKWRTAIEAGNLAVVSITDYTQRLTTEVAMQRNHWAARHASKIVIAEDSSGGSLAVCAAQWRQDGYPVEYLAGA
ncbi:MAG TPA: hypothetical protein VGK14_03160 [Novimethylophilus sp.]|jgi:hypothetical protein|uniref:hypothetical protein n=1 Tax=Novimethylophilus sp. TaxID=2137426 RepID=UPI002F42523D